MMIAGRTKDTDKRKRYENGQLKSKVKGKTKQKV